MIEKNKIYCGDNLTLIKQLDDNCIDLTVTSPPYDNLRTYNGFCWDFEGLAQELFRVTKDGGVVVWVVGDATINGSETGTSFRQALYFMECGFNCETMIYKVPGAGAKGSNYFYWQVFEYMFVFSKGYPKTSNRIKDKKNKRAGSISTSGLKSMKTGTRLHPIGGTVVSDYGYRDNVWEILAGNNGDDSTDHPAPYPEKLAEDHIISWSNKCDLILDPFMGSGTTAKMALKNERDFIGFEISQEYVDIANKRIEGWKEQTRLF